MNNSKTQAKRDALNFQLNYQMVKLLDNAMIDLKCLNFIKEEFKKQKKFRRFLIKSRVKIYQKLKQFTQQRNLYCQSLVKDKSWNNMNLRNIWNSLLKWRKVIQIINKQKKILCSLERLKIFMIYKEDYQTTQLFKLIKNSLICLMINNFWSYFQLQTLDQPKKDKCNFNFQFKFYSYPKISTFVQKENFSSNLEVLFESFISLRNSEGIFDKEQLSNYEV